MASPTSEKNSREIQELQDNVNSLANITDSIAAIDRRQDDYIANMISDFSRQNAAMDSMSSASKSEVKALKSQINNLKAKLQQLKSSSSTQELDAIKTELKKVKKEVSLYKKAAGLNTGGSGGGPSSIDLAKTIDAINGNTTATRSVATSLQHNTQAIRDNTVAVKGLAQSIEKLPSNSEAKPQTATQAPKNDEYGSLSKEKQSLMSETSSLLRRQSDLIGELAKHLSKRQEEPNNEQLAKLAGDVSVIKDHQQGIVDAIRENGSKIQSGIETLRGISSSIGKTQPTKEDKQNTRESRATGPEGGGSKAAKDIDGTIISHLAAINGGVDYAGKGIDNILRVLSGRLESPEGENEENPDNSIDSVLNHINGNVASTSKDVREMVRILGGQAESPNEEEGKDNGIDNVLSHLSAIGGSMGKMSSDVASILAAITAQGEEQEEGGEEENDDDKKTIVDYLGGIDDNVTHISQRLDSFAQALSEKLGVTEAEAKSADDELVRYDEEEENDESNKDAFTKLLSKLDAIYTRQIRVDGDLSEPLNNIDTSNEAIFNAVNSIAQWKTQANDDTTSYFNNQNQNNNNNGNGGNGNGNQNTPSQPAPPQPAPVTPNNGGGNPPSPPGGTSPEETATKTGGSFLRGLGALGKGVLSFVGNFAKEIFGQATDDWRIFNQQAAETGRRMGASFENVDGMTLQLIKDTRDLAGVYGMTREELLQIQDSIISVTGRQAILARQETERMAAVTRVLGGDVMESSVEAFDELGGSVSTAGSAVEGMFKRATALGLDAQKTTREFVRNMNLAKSVTFRSGVDGISKMTALSQRLKLNMQSVASAAQNNFSTIQKSIENAARLQMLGGSFAANFSNPLAAMADATMDMEGFTDRIVETFKGKGTFNAKTGIVEISPVDKALMREAADAIGITYEELATMASQQAKEAEILDKLGKDNFTKAEQALIASKAQFDQDKGVWTVSYFDAQGRVTKTLEELKDNPELLKAIEDGNDPNMAMQKDVHNFHKDFLSYAAHAALSLNEREQGVDTTMRAASTRVVHGGMGAYDKALDNTKGGIVDAISKLSESIGSKLDWLQKYPMEALMAYLGVKGIQQLFKIRNRFKGSPGSSSSSTSRVGSKIKNAAKKVGRAAWNVVKRPVQAVKNVASRAVSGTKNAIKSVGKAAWKSIRHPIQSIRNGGFMGNLGAGRGLGGKLLKGGGGLAGGLVGSIIGDQLFGEGKLLDFGDTGNKIGKILTETAGGFVGGGGPWGAAAALVTGTIREFGKDWGDSLSETGEKLKESDNVFVQGAGYALDSFGGFLTGASEFLNDPLEVMKNKWSQGLTDWGDAMTKNNDGILAGVGKCISALGAGMKEVSEFLEHPIDNTKKLAKKGWESTKEVTKKGWNKLKSVFGFGDEDESAEDNVQHFAEGGIVKGNRFSGDKVSVKANSGEMILSRQMQSNLYRALANPSDGLKNSLTSSVSGPSIPSNINVNISGSINLGGLGNFNFDSMSEQDKRRISRVIGSYVVEQTLATTFKGKNRDSMASRNGGVAITRL